MLAQQTRRNLPREGKLADHSVPRVLLNLWQKPFTGALELCRGHVQKRVLWREGIPILAESNRPTESLCQQLIESDSIGEAHQQRVLDHMEANEVGEGAALLALGMLDPKELVAALREQLRRRVVECFSWGTGRFVLSDGVVPGTDAEALRVDPVQILQDGLSAHWDPDRILADLARHAERYPVPSSRFDALVGRLRRSPEVEGLVAEIGLANSFGSTLYRSPNATTLAAAWVLAEGGGLTFAERPARSDAEGDAAAFDAGLDIEIEVARTPKGGDARDGRGAEPAEESQAISPAAEALRKEVLERHEKLDEMDHYEVLAVPRDAPDAAIKKAYFAHAKRFHPDALARAVLASIHREANELFARIAQAYQTLSHPARRQAYDRSKDNKGPSVDANRVAQAETLFRKGEVLIKVGNFAGALDFLRPCVEIWPEEADYQAALGWALYKKKPSEPEVAREHLEHALELKPDEPVLLFRLGMILRRLGEQEQGQELLDRSKALEKEARQKPTA